jgi:hypothetical protein
LLRLGPRTRAIAFVTEFLKEGNPEAAIALGESRLAEAWPALRDAFEESPIKSEILLGMALMRNDDAIEFLFERVEKDRERVAGVAVEALASYRGDDSIRARMERVINGKNNVALRKAFETFWK